MTLYHKTIRTAALIIAFMLMFDSGYFFPGTEELSQYAQDQIAATVGVSAEIPENEVNKLTAEITKRERELNEREAALEKREIAARASDTSGNISNDLSTYILSTILFILLVLIVMNYVLDYIRARDLKDGYTAHA